MSLPGLLLRSKKRTAAHRYHNMYVHSSPGANGSRPPSSASSAAAAPDNNSCCNDDGVNAAGGSRFGSLTIPTRADDAGPLSVHAAVVGLVAAACRTYCEVATLDVSPSGKTAPLSGVHSELVDFKLTALLLHKYLRRIELGTLELPSRAALVDVDVLVAVLTASVMAIAELDGRLEELVREARVLGVPPADICHRFARPLAKDANRISMLGFIVTMMLSVLQVSDETEAGHHRAQAEEPVIDMLQADIALAARMATLDDPFAARATVPVARIAEIEARPPPPYSFPSPSSTAELPDYATAAAHADGSVTIRPCSWSIFSGLHLNDVHGAVRRIAIPIARQEIRHGAEFYAAGFADQMHDAFGELAEQNTKNKAKQLLQILGLRDQGEESSSHRSFVRRITTRYGPAPRLTQRSFQLRVSPHMI